MRRCAGSSCGTASRRPTPAKGLEEAPGLAICAGTIRSSPEMTDPQGPAAGDKTPRAVTGSVVGQDAFDAHPGRRNHATAPEERGAGHALLVA